MTQLWVEVADQMEAVDTDMLRSDRIADLRIGRWAPPHALPERARRS